MSVGWGVGGGVKQSPDLPSHKLPASFLREERLMDMAPGVRGQVQGAVASHWTHWLKEKCNGKNVGLGAGEWDCSSHGVLAAVTWGKARTLCHSVGATVISRNPADEASGG